MLTVEQEDAQDFCVRVCQLKLGKGETSGHYIDLDAGQGAPDWWFYCNFGDGDIDCYPVTDADMAEVYYPIIEI
jgi:hypothetical protein